MRNLDRSCFPFAMRFVVFAAIDAAFFRNRDKRHSSISALPLAPLFRGQCRYLCHLIAVCCIIIIH